MTADAVKCAGHQAPGANCERDTDEQPSATGSDFSMTACTSVKIAVFAPTPMASVNTAVRVNPGALRSWRAA
jgi:hypothetical protein